jgi:hypothetical protein
VGLEWSSSETDKELVFDMQHDQGMLSTLEPPPQIKDLGITGYQGSSVDDGSK